MNQNVEGESKKASPTEKIYQEMGISPEVYAISDLGYFFFFSFFSFSFFSVFNSACALSAFSFNFARQLFLPSGFSSGPRTPVTRVI